MAYEYLVSSLYELTPEGSSQETAVFEDLTADCLSPRDAAAARFCFAANEIYNAVMLRRREAGRRYPSVFSEADLAESLDSEARVPAGNPLEKVVPGGIALPFLLPCLSPESFSDTPSALRSATVKFLNGLFGEDAALYSELCGKEGLAFLRGWYGFDTDLRNAILILEGRGADCLPFGFAAERGDDKALADAEDDLPWLSGLRVVLRSENPLSLELELERLRWAELDRLGGANPFSASWIWAYGLRLAGLDRFRKLDETQGRAFLARLIASLQEQLSLSK